jgi:deoxyribodipyrimidine photolyase-related protein
MSDYKKDKWCDLLNALYYNFINKHKDYLSSNYATARQVAFWNKKSESEKKQILLSAKIYLKNKFTLK